jgi:hypothetical protein
MKRRLHITNGDSVVDLLRESSVEGEVLAWRDALHEGPVPGGLTPERLSRIRARFIASEHWGGEERQVQESFRRRDAALAHGAECDEVVLWFEHDLYDQLQLLQLLHWFENRAHRPSSLSLICIGEYPDLDAFHGLGQLTPDQLAALELGRHPLSEDQLARGHDGWNAFTFDNPLALMSFLERDLGALQYVGPALRRHLEQFPATVDGLARTERQILRAATRTGATVRTLWESNNEQERWHPLGDLSFLRYLRELSWGDRALIDLGVEGPIRWEPPFGPELWQTSARPTHAGTRVLDGELDRVSWSGLDRWYGGMHLRPGAELWRWDRDRERPIVDRGVDA